MSIAIANSNVKVGYGDNGASCVITFDTLPTNGNAVIVLFTQYMAGSSSPSCTDNQSGSPNTYTPVAVNNQNFSHTAILYCLDITVNAGTFVLTLPSGTSGYTSCVALEVSGLNTTGYDQHGDLAASVDTPITVTADGATAQAAEFLVAACSIDPPGSVTWGHSQGGSDPATWIEAMNQGGATHAAGHGVYQIVSSTGTFAHVWSQSTGTRNVAASLATFKGAGDGPVTLNQPTLSSPTDSATGQSLNVNLEWTDENTSPAETNHRVRIKESGASYQYYDFGAGVTVGSAATALGSALSYSTEYFWSVEAVGDGGVTTDDSGYPTDFSFTTESQPVAPNKEGRIFIDPIFGG